MERAREWSNLATGVCGAVFIAGAFLIPGSDVDLPERFGYFLVGTSLILLCFYVFQIEKLPQPNFWENAAKATSFIIGVLFVLLIIFLTWFVIMLLKAVTEAVGDVLGGG